MVVNIGAASLDNVFNRRVVMPSGPAAFDGSSFSSIFSTPVFVIRHSLVGCSIKGHLASFH